MNTNRYSLIIFATVAFILGFFAFTSPARGAGEGGERIIPLSSTGSEIAHSVAYSPDGVSLAVGTSSGVFIYNTRTFERELVIPTGVWARDVLFSPDGETIAAALFDGTARIWRAADGVEVHNFSGHGGWVRGIAFSPDGTKLYTAADDDTLRVWDIETSSIDYSVTGLAGMRVLALSPDGQTIAVGLQDKTIQLLKAANGELIRVLEGHKDWVRSLAFSPDGQTLASGAFDSDAILWDVTSGKMKFLLEAPQSSVLGVSFSPDGQTLATSSVDRTVMLWNVADGTLTRTLVGHEDFVYAVRYSPDGASIASGSSDNTLRIWTLSDNEAGNLPAPETPKDCRICHHPYGNNAPPRVIQIKCEACHANGVTVNFCPLFQRDPNATSLPLIYTETGLPVGLPIVSDNLSVTINYPTNGENLYSSYASRAPLVITGQVNSVGNASDVLVHLDVYSGDEAEATISLETHPTSEGRFVFKTLINPKGASSANLKPGGVDCRECHEDYLSQGDLPNGIIHMKVTASLAQETATDERWLRMDTSKLEPIAVQVIDNETSLPVEGLTVNASAILYEWRARYARQHTGADGIAALNIEKLNQAATTYQLTVPDTAINGYYYSTIQPASITLLPGDDQMQSVEIRVQVKKSKIQGRLNGLPEGSVIDVLAIHLPDGQVTKTTSVGSVFEFNELPEGDYQLIPDAAVAAELGLIAKPIFVDLLRSAEAEVVLALEPSTGQIYHGQLLDKNGNILPFGWANTLSGETSIPDPLTGKFTGSTAGSSDKVLTLSAPGYYSQRQMVSNPNGSLFSYVMEIKPETVSLSWGEGAIILPFESVYTREGDGIHLTRGWIWGKSKISEPITIHAANKLITISAGSFALQYLPPSDGYLYMLEGKAVIQNADGTETQVTGPEMITISNTAVYQPTAYDGRAVSVLRNAEGTRIPLVWETSLQARIQNGLVGIGIGSIQIITFVTYSIVIVVLVALFLRGLYWFWNWRKQK